MTSADLSTWLQRLESLHPAEIELGLDRVRAVAERLGLLPYPIPCLTIAGTNGKGSVAAVAEASLLALGCRVGAYTSPHFLQFAERIRILGEPAADADIVTALARIDAARGDISLTYFEFTTLAALVLFLEQGVELAVLEVGLGGRLDAVNIIDPVVAVITRIDLDHQDWLGDTRELIGAEKAGILRPDRPAVIADPEPPESVREAGAASAYYCLGRDWLVHSRPGGHSLQLMKPAGEQLAFELDGPPGLLGPNVGAALQALLLLGFPVEHPDVAARLAGLHVPGRRQRESLNGVEVLLDVAHNPAAVAQLHNYLGLNPCTGKTIALFSVMADKDIRGMIHACATDMDAWFLADIPALPRAARAADVAQWVHEAGGSMISVNKNLRQAWRRVFSLLQPGDRLVVFGSFFTVAGVLPLLDRDRAKQAETHSS